MNEKKSDANDNDVLWQQAGKSPDDIRVEGMTDIKNMMLLGQVLFQRDAARMEKELGKDHPRVEQIRTRLKTQAKAVSDLEIKLELEKIKVPSVPERGALVHGRVADRYNRGISGLKITIEDEKERTLRSLGWTETDASGYYALIFDSSKIKKLMNLEGAYLVISTQADKIVHREPETIKAAPGDQVVVDVTLNRVNLSPSKATDTTKKKQVDNDSTPPDEPAAASDIWIVEGRVKDASGRSLSGVTVSVFDKDLFFDDRLGTAVTDDVGNYQLVYRTKDFGDLVESNPDLYVEARDRKGRKFYSSRRSIRFEAGRKEVFNIKTKKI